MMLEIPPKKKKKLKIVRIRMIIFLSIVIVSNTLHWHNVSLIRSMTASLNFTLVRERQASDDDSSSSKRVQSSSTKLRVPLDEVEK